MLRGNNMGWHNFFGGLGSKRFVWDWFGIFLMMYRVTKIFKGWSGKKLGGECTGNIFGVVWQKYFGGYSNKKCHMIKYHLM